MTIHKLTETDLSQLILIEELAHISPWTEEVFRRCFASKHHVFGVKEAENLVGFVIYSMQVGECHILNLCVHPTYQKQGFGLALMTHALKVAKEQGAGIAFLEVRRSNAHALLLYKKMGFVQIAERKGYYAEDKNKKAEDALIFAKDLGVA
jgi:ribosomal-protein-alanine N-acetyltransferase